MTWTNFFDAAAVFEKTELGRLLASMFVVSITALLLKLLQKQARAGFSESSDVGRRRRTFVMVKNLVFTIAAILIFSIWASKIAGAALSLAAVVGATLIVAKEFLANILGSAMLAISRPYRVGDFIELADVSGRVVDSDMLVTTIAETQQGSQLTGRTVSLPHSLLLVRPVRNLTATGYYVVNMLPVNVHPHEDLLAHEAALLSAAAEVCGGWLADVNRHLELLESRDLVDLPSAAPRVIITMHGARDCTLALRYPCRPNERVKVEQDIIRRYLRTRPKKVISALA